MNTEHSSRSDLPLRINVTWQWFTIMPDFILTFWLFQRASGWVNGMEGLLWSQRVPGDCFWVVGYLRRLRVARVLWAERQGRVGGRDLRVEVTLLLPWHARALHVVFSQVSDRNLHVGKRVGVPMARWADFLEVICGVDDTQKVNNKLWKTHLHILPNAAILPDAYRKAFTQNTAGQWHVLHGVNPQPRFENTRVQVNNHNQGEGEDHMSLVDLWAVWACEWKASRGLAHWTIVGRLFLFVYHPDKPRWWWIHYNREVLCTLFDLKPAAAYAERACKWDTSDERCVVTVSNGTNAENVDLIVLSDDFKWD